MPFTLYQRFPYRMANPFPSRSTIPSNPWVVDDFGRNGSSISLGAGRAGIFTTNVLISSSCKAKSTSRPASHVSVISFTPHRWNNARWSWVNPAGPHKGTTSRKPASKSRKASNTDGVKISVRLRFAAAWFHTPSGAVDRYTSSPVATFTPIIPIQDSPSPYQGNTTHPAKVSFPSWSRTPNP